MKDFYTMLGLPPTASVAEIRSAIDRLEQIYPEGTSASERLLEARAVLLDQQKRFQYDLELKAAARKEAQSQKKVRLNNLPNAAAQHRREPAQSRSSLASAWLRNLQRLLKVSKGKWVENAIKQLVLLQLLVWCTGNTLTFGAIDFGLVVLMAMDWSLLLDVPATLDKHGIKEGPLYPELGAASLSSLVVFGCGLTIAFMGHYLAFYVVAPELYLLCSQLLIYLQLKKIARMEKLATSGLR